MSFNNPEEEVEVEADSASDSICINAKDKEQQQGEERAGAKVKDKKQSVSVSNSNSNSNNKSNINSNSNSNNPRQRQSSGSGNGKTKGDGHFSLATGANRNPVGSRHQHQHPHNRRLLLRQSSSSSFRQLGSHLRRQSSLLVDSLHSQLPATPTGWAVSTTALASLVLQYELNLQDKLTAPPHVFCQVRDTLAAAVAGIDAAAAAAATVAAGDTTCLTYGAGGMNDKMERLYQKLAHPRDCGCQDPDGPSMQQQQQPQSQQHQQGIFTRDIKPSLVIGSRGLFSSTAAYIMGDRSGNNTAHRVRRCREIMKMGADGALIALDWEIPVDDYENNHENHVNHRNSNNNNSNNNNSNDSNSNGNTPDQPPKHIDKPLVLLLHGMNNDSSFGYIRSMMRTATSRGWKACAINMRGQGGVELTTPRAYNAGFTGDLRGVILQLEKRLVRSKTTTSTTTRRKRERCAGTRENDTVDTDSNANSNANANANASANASANEKEKQGTTGPDPEPTIPDQDDDCTDDNTHEGGPIFLLGYSLGANLITKYLGEESLHGTLPKCIAGGAAMGNPLHIHSGSIAFPWNMLLAAGIKRTILQNYNTLRRFREPNYQAAVKKALMSRTIAQLDDSFSRYLIRNEGRPPYEMKLGYDGGGEEYWRDASSHRCVAHVSVPLLKISAQDDFLVFGQFAKKLNHCLENPNVIVVKTRCGGHLGWQESPPLPSVNKGGGKGGGGKGAGWFGGTGSWSDVAVADFIEALLQIREEDRQKKEEKKEKTRMLEMVAGGFRQDDDNGDGDGDGNFATTSIRNERKVLNDPISARQSKIVSRL